MGLHWSQLDPAVLTILREGAVIPAHPLALDRDRALDRRRQQALSRYYIDAGAGGLAVGVHATQFAIREVGLYRPVLGARCGDRAGMDITAARARRRPRRAHRPGGQGGAR